MLVSSAREEAYAILAGDGRIALYLPDGGAVTLRTAGSRWHRRRFEAAVPAWKDPVPVIAEAGKLALDDAGSGLFILTPAE